MPDDGLIKDHQSEAIPLALHVQVGRVIGQTPSGLQIVLASSQHAHRSTKASVRMRCH